MTSSGGATREAPATVTVCVRKRPLSRKEVHGRDRDIVTVNHEDGCLFVNEVKEKVDLTKYVETHTFSFDNVFGENVGNEAVYDGTARPLVDTLFTGGRGTCFAYGQTGAGKTFTMAGDGDENPGLYTLAVRDVFDRIRELEGEAWRDAEERGVADDFEPPDPPEVWISFYEIYGTRLQDLLNRGAKLECREDGNSEVQIVGLTERLCEVEEDVLDLIKSGSLLRSTGVTGANDDSSRSHAVFQIELREPPPTSVRQDANAALRESLLRSGVNMESSRVQTTSSSKRGDEIGRLCFIDLAGSERGSDTASSTRQTRMEGAEINKSLLALKECIRAMDKRKDHTPFRGSKLTQVLKASFLGKKCRTVMIANISPAASNVEHTLNTLRYSDRVKEIKRERGGGGGTVASVRRTTLSHGATFSHGVGMRGGRTTALTAKQTTDGNDPFGDDLTTSSNVMRSMTVRCKLDSDADDGMPNTNSRTTIGLGRSVTQRRITRNGKGNTTRPSEVPVSVSYPSPIVSSTPQLGSAPSSALQPHHPPTEISVTLRPNPSSTRETGSKDTKYIRRRTSKAPVDVGGNSTSRPPAPLTTIPRSLSKSSGINPNLVNIVNSSTVATSVRSGVTTSKRSEMESLSNNLESVNVNEMDTSSTRSRRSRDNDRTASELTASTVKRAVSPPVTRQRARQLDRKREKEQQATKRAPQKDRRKVADYDDGDLADDDDDDDDDDVEEEDDEDVNVKDDMEDDEDTFSTRSGRKTDSSMSISGAPSRGKNVAESAMKYYLGRDKVGKVKDKEKVELLHDEDLLFASTDDFDSVEDIGSGASFKPKTREDKSNKVVGKINSSSVLEAVGSRTKASGSSTGMRGSNSTRESDISRIKKVDNNSKKVESVSTSSNDKPKSKELSAEMKQVIRMHHMQIEELMRLTEADVAMVNAIEKGDLDAQEYALKLSVNLSQKLDIVKTLQAKLSMLE